MLKFKTFNIQETKISLEYHDELNPKLWDGDKLKPEIREKLLKFGDAWAEFAKLDKSDRKSTRLNSSHIPLSRMPSSA